MNHPPTPDERYDALAQVMLGQADVTLGSPGKNGFGTGALQLRGRVFAMLTAGTLVVKLPRQRVDALVASGDGNRFDPRRDGRLMKEWLVVAPTSEQDWLSLARDALEFVGSRG